MNRSTSGFPLSSGDPIQKEHGERSFFIVFIATFACAIAVTCAVSYMLDVTGLYGVRWVPPIESTSREDKANLFAQSAEPPQLVIMGSSRVWPLRVSCARELTGLRSFNFGIDAANADDFIAIWRFLSTHDHGQVRRILLELEPEALSSNRFRRWRGAFSRSLRPYIDWRRRSSRFNLDVLIGAETLSADLTSIRRIISGEARKKHPPQFDAFGEDTREEDNHRLAAEITEGIQLLKGLYANFNEIAPIRIAVLREMLKDMRRHGVTVDVMVPPIHPKVQAALNNTKFDARRMELLQLLARLQADGLVQRFYDFTDLSSFGGNPDQFSDFWHMLRSNGDRMLNRIYSGTGCAVQ